MCFIAAGMGGGTGTGAAPVIAEAARRMGVLTVGVVTKPFLFEGTRRMKAAEAGIEELQKHVDTLIVIPNQNLFLVAKAETTFKEAFILADEVLQQGVRSITDLMVMPGLINLDFADVRSVMSEMGKAMMGTGEAEGEDRAIEAAKQAIANPLLDGVSMQGAKGVIISIIGGEDMKLLEVDEAATHIRELVDEDANIIWGSAFNPDLEGKIRVSVVATGIEQGAMPAQAEQRPFTLSASRPPKRPALDPVPVLEPEPEPEPIEEELEPLELSEAAPEEEPVADEAEDVLAKNDAAGFSLSSYDDEEDDEDFDDVDGIVDPLEGLRNEHTERFDIAEGESLEQVADDSEHAVVGADGGFGDESDAEPLDLGSMEIADDEAGADELLLGEDDLASGDSEPAGNPLGRRRGLVSSEEASSGGVSGDGETGAAGGSGGGGAGGDEGAPAKNAAAAGGGSTLFERMANLSRGSGSDDDDDEDEEEDSSSLSIPRFLGRQNNQ